MHAKKVFPKYSQCSPISLWKPGETSSSSVQWVQWSHQLFIRWWLFLYWHWYIDNWSRVYANQKQLDESY